LQRRGRGARARFAGGEQVHRDAAQGERARRQRQRLPALARVGQIDDATAHQRHGGVERRRGGRFDRLAQRSAGQAEALRQALTFQAIAAQPIAQRRHLGGERRRTLLRPALLPIGRGMARDVPKQRGARPQVAPQGEAHAERNFAEQAVERRRARHLALGIDARVCARAGRAHHMARRSRNSCRSQRQTCADTLSAPWSKRT
jgi:hypothetical protein